MHTKIDYLASRKNYGEFHVEMFRLWWSFLNVQGAIDGTHIFILKPKGEYAKDYYCHKTKWLKQLWSAIKNSLK
jgi:hypothetical protein